MKAVHKIRSHEAQSNYDIRNRLFRYFRINRYFCVSLDKRETSMERQHAYNSLKDETLWDFARHGDAKALSVLYRRHYDLMFNFGLKYVRDEEVVKDCIQDIFVKFSVSRRLSHTDYVRSYFLTSLRNSILDKLAARKPADELDERAFRMEIEDAEIERMFSHSDEQVMLGKKLMAAYEELTENQRTAIYLRFVSGLSYKEIAAVLGIAPQSSMNLVSRALARLRAKMTPEEFLMVCALLASRIVVSPIV